MAKILVVDDEPTNRLLLITILEYAHHVLAEASNCADALEIAREQHPDLIIMDLHMPGMSGIDFIKELRSDPEIATARVALYTATVADPSLRDFMELTGIRHVIAKPSDPPVVLETVKTILAE